MMTKKWHIGLLFRWFDFWIGFFFDRSAKTVYICLLPMLPIKIWFTEHEICSECGSIMHKTALDTGDGWALFWDCEKEPGVHQEKEIDWPWPKDEYLFGIEIMRRGFTVV